MGRRLGRRTCLVVITGLLSLALAGQASAATTSKPYVLTVSPGLTAASQNVSITANFNNLTGPPGGQQLGSANLFWPTGVFPNVTATVPDPGTATVGTCTFGTFTGPCIQLRNLSLQPSQQLNVTITPTAPTPACSTATGSWLVEAKQSNDFSGSPGNDLTLSAASQLTSTLDGACSLAWNAQPQASLTGQPVTSLPEVTLGGPITVNFVDSSGNVAKGSIDGQLDGPVVTLTASSNPGAATLAGNTVNGVGGVASFNALTVSEPGDGYTLSASSGTLPASPASNAFSVVDKAVSCSVNTKSCSTKDGNGNGNGQILANATTTSGTGELTLSANSNNSSLLPCAGYVSADQNVYEFDGPPDRSKVGTITITDPNPLSPTLAGNANQVLAAQQICFDSPVEFTTAFGSLAPPDGSGGFIGLLPTCTTKTTGPCHNRKQDSTPADAASPLGFDLVLVADIPPGGGDPHMS